MYNIKVAGARFGGAGIAALLLSAAMADPFALTRASLAKNATFTVTQTVAAKGAAPVTQVYRVEVKGDKARVDFSDPTMGSQRFLVNEKGFFLYTPANNAAMKQQVKGGVEFAIQAAFSQMQGALKKAKLVGTATISGQPTDMYRDATTNAVAYLGKNVGFRLPIKLEETNVGGKTSLLVTDIHLNPALSDADFALPKGAQVIDTAASSGGLR